MSIKPITHALHHQSYRAAMQEFASAFPAYAFPNAFRGALAVFHPDEYGQDSLITLRCCLDQFPPETGSRPFFIGLRFTRFGLSTTLDLVSIPLPTGADPARLYVRQFHGWVPFADRIDTQFGSRPLPIPLISVTGQMTIEANGELGFLHNEGKPATLLGVDAVVLARTITSYFDLMTAEESADRFFISLLDFLPGHQGKPEFYEQFVLWLHERRVRVTPELAEALYAMKAADHARTENIDICSAYLREISDGLVTVIEPIQAVQRTW